MKPFAALFLWFNSLLLVDSLPYFILSEKGAKCIGINAPQNTKITINYHFPDVVAMTEEDKEDPDEVGGSNLGNGQVAPDELSKVYNERFKVKMEAMKKMGKKMNDVSVTMFQIRSNNADMKKNRRRDRDDDELKGTVRLREEITKNHGVLTFLSSPREYGIIDVCVQSMSASHTAPSRYSLKVEMEPYVDPLAEAAKNKAKIVTEVSGMQRDLQGIERKIEMIMNTADWAKEQEITVHARSISISRASAYWPIIHIVVLLVAGYTQASHVARYFNKHHIV